MKNLNKILFSMISPVVAPQCREGAAGGPDSWECLALDEKTLRAVYALAKRHDLAHLLLNGKLKIESGKSGTAGDGANDVPNIAELVAELERARLTAAWRVKNIEIEQGRVGKCLSEARIPHIFLKGAVMRSYYPETWMRTSSDVDVLVPQDMLGSAVKALEDGIGYRVRTREIHDVSIFSKSGVHLDMHTLFEGDTEDCALLSSAWEMARGKTQDGCDGEQAQNTDFERFLTPEHFYFYHVAHMAEHMRSGGCGIRTFIDLYLINSRLTFDRSALDRLLCERGLYRFERAAVRLANAWMLGEDAKDLAPFEEYVLTGGVYGNVEQGVAVRRRDGRGKFSYIMRRIFMPYEELKQRHPSLDGRRWLTPVYEVWRWLSLIDPKRSKRSRSELKSTVKLDEEKRTSVADLFDSLGI